MKVMLFVPPGGYFAERWSKGVTMPTLGLLYIAAVLEKNGIKVEVVPADVLKLSWNDIGRKVRLNKPDIVGITTTTENRFLSFKLARIAKDSYPPAFAVLGGPHFTTTANDTLLNVPEVDGVISGEGEETMLELAISLKEGKELKKICGLSFRQNGQIFHNAPRDLIKDLNNLPLPARHLVPWEKYNFKIDIPGKGLLPTANLMTSRGCPFTCTFCATPKNWGREVRSLSPENVIKEIEHAIEHYNVKAIWFYDDTFNFSPKRTIEICELIIKKRLDIHWYCEVRVDILTKELLGKMVEAGLCYVGFGIESGSERISKDIITKKATVEQAYNVIDWCKEFNITANPFFIFSHPTETWEESKETMRIIEGIKGKCDISVSLLHIYPGTLLEQRAVNEGKLPGNFSWSKPKDKRVIVFPAAQGHVPLYIDRLTWPQISELLIRFSQNSKQVKLINKIPKVFQSIYSIADVKRYLILFIVFLKFKLNSYILENFEISSSRFQKIIKLESASQRQQNGIKKIDASKRNISKITVMHVCDKFCVAGSSIDGVSRVLSWWIPRFDKERFNILICGMNKQDRGGKTLEKLGIEITYLNKAKFNPMAFFSLFRLIKQVRPDILHLHGYRACTFGRIAGSIYKIPTIVHEHFVSREPSFYIRIIDKLLARLTTHSIAISIFVKDFLVKKRCMPEEKVDVIYNGIPLQKFKEVNQVSLSRLKEELNLNGNKQVVGTIGRLDKIKGMKSFIRSALKVIKNNKDVVFIIVGDGPQENELKSLIEEMGLKKEILLLGYREDVPEILSLIDIFVISSMREGASLTVLEAMSAGKAIVSTNVGGLREILEDRKTALLVPPEDFNSMASAITELVKNVELRESLAVNAEIASKRYDIDFAVNRIQNLYLNLIRGH